MHIGNKAHFEQDNTYTDMDGNLKTFTIRDYSKKLKVAMANTSTEESRAEANDAYEASIKECVDEICSENPPIFAKDHRLAVHIYGHITEWNRDALELMFKDPEAYRSGSDLDVLKKMLVKNILEHLGHITTPFNYTELIDSFRKEYKETEYFCR